MFDLNWLSDQAKNVHDVFTGIFFAFITVLIVLSVVCEQLKMPFSQAADVTHLVGRALIAALLLYSYPDVTNAIADFSDQLAQRVGDFNNFHLVLNAMGGKLSDLTWSWTSVKDSLILVFSFLTFFILYISVYLADAGIVYCWTLLYVFSPLLLALFVLPQTSFATKTLYRALFEVSAWKVVWSVLATLLWSSALGHMNDEGSKLNFLTVIAYNLILALSLLLTPFVVNALASKGLAQATSGWLGMAASAAVFSPGAVAKAAAVKTAASSMGFLKTGTNLMNGARFTKNAITGKAAGAGPKLGSTAGKIAAPSIHAPSSSHPAMPKPPAWHKDVPPPSEAPTWVIRRMEREKKGQSASNSKSPDHPGQ
jgi:hypothetical protein